MDNMIIYASTTTASLVLTTISVFLFFIVSLRSSQCLHDRVVEATLHAQLSFFDTNPTGRILNRFSRDVGCMDELLPQIFILCIQDILFVSSAILLPAITNPWLLLVVFPTIVVFVLFGRYYLKTSRELKRLESICRSPVFSHFSETMTGLETIRTRGMQGKFIEQFYRYAIRKRILDYLTGSRIYPFLFHQVVVFVQCYIICQAGNSKGVNSKIIFCLF